MKSLLSGESELEIALSQSQFKRQVDSLGYDVFYFLLDMYEEGKVNSRIKSMFPLDKKEQFDEVSNELSGNNLEKRKVFYGYLMSSDDHQPRIVFGRSYDFVMEMKDKLLEKFKMEGYKSLYENFVNAQFNDNLIDAEGDDFFYLKDERFISADKDEELIWIFGKTVEFPYSCSMV